MLSETQNVTASEAQNLGLGPGPGGRVEIPRWRYAIVNFPHPLLAMGLTILDTPGVEALGTEPELTMHRLQEADAVVFMLSVDTGATDADLALWREHVEPIEGLGHTRYVVLNKIDEPARRREARERRSSSRSTGRCATPPRRCASTPRRSSPSPPGRASSRASSATATRWPRAGSTASSRRWRAASCTRAGVDHATCRPRGGARAPRRAPHPDESRRYLRRGAGGGARPAAGQEPEARRIPGPQGGRRAAAASTTRKPALAGLRAVHNRHADELAKLLDPTRARDAGLRARGAVLVDAVQRGHRPGGRRRTSARCAGASCAPSR